jgi:murein L,D-transpeptidase YcbB/YkuD
VLRSFLILATFAVRAAHGSALDEVTDRLRARLDGVAADPKALAVEGQPLHATDAVAHFYELRVFRPAWVDAGRSFDPVHELLDTIRTADRHGLYPTDYHQALLEGLLAQDSPVARDGNATADHELLVDLELAATDAFLVYGAHLAAGRVDPVRLASDWSAATAEGDLASLLERAATSGEIAAALASLEPAAAGYRRLQDALAQYRELAAKGGWPGVPEGPKLGSGMSGERVRLLRQRLAVTRDLEDDPDSEIFDTTLESAVRRFQERHGLEVDGVVGPATLAAVKVSAAERVTQIAINLERWRWLPRDLGGRYLLVNVPAFELRVVEDDIPVMKMRAVVGRPYRRTPIFSATMTYLVVSPYWHVPPGIAVRDILPAIKKDPAYLAEQGIRVFEGRGADEQEMDPGTIDWKSLSATRFPYHFRQEPGDRNMLGRLKFMFPNWYNVYLHDTPLRELFSPASRPFSSGCIRIERPFGLADYLLRGDTRWTPEAIAAAASVDRETTISLRQPIPVHVLYWTSWADGEIEFRDDVYSRDAALAAALTEPPPKSPRDPT